MLPFEKLTYHGQVRRLREMAVEALTHFHLDAHRLTFIKHAENTTFRVFEEGKTKSGYLLRIHRPNYQTKERIISELNWLAALGRDLELPIQKPLLSMEQTYLVTIDILAVPEARHCSVLQWLPGRFHRNRVKAHHAYSLGVTMAMLHEHALSWKRPRDFNRRHWDYDGLFGQAGGYDLTPADLWSRVPKESARIFLKAARLAGAQIEKWKSDESQYNLLHADLHLGNVLFDGGRALPLDFDDCGFGPWVYDFAVPLADWLPLPNFKSLYRNLVDGYASVRQSPTNQLEHIDLFIAARRVSLALWFIDRASVNPRFVQLAIEWLPRLTSEVRSLLDSPT